MTEHKGHTPNPRTEIKIPDSAGNRTRAAGRDSTNHATATDAYRSLLFKKSEPYLRHNTSEFCHLRDVCIYDLDANVGNHKSV